MSIHEDYVDPLKLSWMDMEVKVWIEKEKKNLQGGRMDEKNGDGVSRTIIYKRACV